MCLRNYFAEKKICFFSGSQTKGNNSNNSSESKELFNSKIFIKRSIVSICMSVCLSILTNMCFVVDCETDGEYQTGIILHQSWWCVRILQSFRCGCNKVISDCVKLTDFLQNLSGYNRDTLIVVIVMLCEALLLSVAVNVYLICMTRYREPCQNFYSRKLLFHYHYIINVISHFITQHCSTKYHMQFCRLLFIQQIVLLSGVAVAHKISLSNQMTRYNFNRCKDLYHNIYLNILDVIDECEIYKV